MTDVIGTPMYPATVIARMILRAMFKKLIKKLFKLLSICGAL